jgi:TonB-dependent SusC/RagA subfamily outer membrane receptor
MRFAVRGARAVFGLGGLLLASAMEAQQGTVLGRVVDQATGLPLAGARIQSLDQQVYGLSNQQGRYAIRGLAPTAHTLRVFLPGYGSATREATVTVGAADTVDWALEPVPFQLDELVGTATGERAARELGTSVAQIAAAQLVATAPTATPMQVLSGRLAGVNVLQSNGTSGTGARIRIRGVSSLSLTNDPLLYVDGIRVAADAAPGAYIGGGTVSKLNDLDPEEIETIEVVKGPSAATLYGTQAANGVIRVTTKRGKAGPPAWTVWLEGGLLADPHRYPGTWFSKAVGSNRICLPFQQALGQCRIDRLLSLFLLDDPDTTPFGTGFRAQQGASVSGGSESLRYFISAETELETGPLKLPDAEARYLEAERGVAELPHDQLRPNHFNKHNFRINLNASPRPNLDLAVSSGLVVNGIRLPQTGDNYSSMIGTPLLGSPNPATIDATGGYGFSRPANSIGKETFRKDDHFINSATVTWRPATWLSARGIAGLDYLRYSDEQFTQNGQGCLTCTTNGLAERQGFKRLDNWTDAKYTVDLSANAQFGLGARIAARTSFGVQYNHDRLFGVLASAGPFPPGTTSLGAGGQKILTEQTRDVLTLGTYLEQQVGLDDRVFLTGAVRIDDNSAFGRAFRSARYPKLSAAWQALEGRADRFLGSLRFRAAIGTSGQAPRPLDAITYDAPITASVFGSPNTPGVVLGALGDERLRPERAREVEAGFDAALFANRVNLELTLYHKRTTDALAARPLPPSGGTGVSRMENVGTVTNRGIELSVSARPIERTRLTWDLQVEAAVNRNRLVSLAPGVPPLTGFGNKNGPGYPLFGLWWPALRAWQDRNGDGFISPNEVQITDSAVFLGSTIPTRTLSVNQVFGLFRGRLRIGGQLDYRGGFVTHNVTKLFQCGFQQNCQDLHDPSTPLEAQARAIASPRAYGVYAEPGDFIRLREVSIAWQADRSVARLVGAKAATLVAAGRNVALQTFGFTGWDPENVTGSTDASNFNFVEQAQPLTLILRVNLSY